MLSRRWFTRGSVLALTLAAACKDSPTGTDLTPSGALSMDYCAANVPVWFGIKNEGGAWQMVTPDASNTYHFDASSRFIMAVVTPYGEATALAVTFTTAAEFAGISGVVCDELNAPRTYNGSVVGLATTENASINLGSRGKILSGDGNYSIDSVPDLPMDLLAIRRIRQSDTDRPDRIIIRRAINPSTQSPLPRLDFTAAEAFAPESAAVTITGMLDGSDRISLYGGITTATGTRGSLLPRFRTSDAGTLFALPAAQLIANDLQYVGAIALNHLGFTRSIVKYFRTPVSQALDVGPIVKVPSFSSSESGGVTLLRMQLTAQPEYADAVAFQFHQVGVIRGYQTLTATSAYFGGSPATWDLATPDMHSAPGFQRAWALQTNRLVWVVAAYGVNRPVVILGAQPLDGETVRYSARNSNESMSLRPRLPDRVR